MQINVSISYHNAFLPGSPPIVLTNLAYERVCLLFNLAALLSQLADGEDRSTPEGIKRATAYYQVLHSYSSRRRHILTTRTRTPPARWDTSLTMRFSLIWHRLQDLHSPLTYLNLF